MIKETGFVNYPFKKRVFLLAALAVGLFLPITGAGHAASLQTGVVATVAPDWSSSAVSVISVDPVEGPRTVINNQLVSPVSDITVKAFGPYYYRIGRFMADNIAKASVNAPDTVIWQYSTNDPGEMSSNPYDLIFVHSRKAYLTRFGSKTAWIVNPSATTEREFKIGELDLSAYADEDGIPEMSEGVIANGKLFLILNRQDAFFCPSNTAYVAVFDVATDTEIDTGLGQGNMKGIPLPIRNALHIAYLPENNRIYVQGVGSYPGFCDPVYEYTGGIVSIDPMTYETAMVVDDGDADYHPYGSIAGMLMVSPTLGYFVGYDGWEDNTVYRFNPTTGAVAGALNGFRNLAIAGMESGIYLDKNAMMWVCNQTHATIDIVDTKNDTLIERLDTHLNPQSVAFSTIGPPPSPVLGFLVYGTTVQVHWNISSGAEGYLLWALAPDLSWSALFDVGTATGASADFPEGVNLYVAIIPYNDQGTGASSNVVNIKLSPAP